jgi:GNAT superfamily N-acetyltransferase
LTELLVEDDRLDSRAAAPLVQALWSELLTRYGQPDADPDGLTADDLAPPDGAFVVARLDGEAVACGGVRRYDTGVGELKRMYVVPSVRGRGLSRVVLAELEDRAAACGYTRLVLETGVRQPEAMRLYASTGYTLIEPYGFYRGSPLSRCFAKTLTAARDPEPDLSSGRRPPGASPGRGTRHRR